MSSRIGYIEAIVDVRCVLIEAIKSNEGNEAIRSVLIAVDEKIYKTQKQRMIEFDKELIDDQRLHSDTPEFPV